MRVLDENGSEIELKDEDEDDFIPDMRDETYADDSELEAGGFAIEDVPEEDCGGDVEYTDYDEEDE